VLVGTEITGAAKVVSVGIALLSCTFAWTEVVEVCPTLSIARAVNAPTSPTAPVVGVPIG